MWLLFALIISASYAGLVRQLLIRQDYNWIHSFEELLNTKLPIVGYHVHLGYLNLFPTGQQLLEKVTAVSLPQIPEFMIKAARNKAVVIGDEYFFEGRFQAFNSENLRFKVSEERKFFAINSLYPVNKHSVYGKRIDRM